MTEPTLPAPQPEAGATRRRLSRKWIIAIAGAGLLVLVLGGAAYGIHTKGDAKAKDYAKAVDAWNDKRSDLLGAPAEANSDLWVLVDDPTSKSSLSLQKTTCARVETIRSSAAKNAKSFPTTQSDFFDVLSSAKRQAVKDSAAREKAVKAYAAAADKVLVQMHKDCLWNAGVNSRQNSGSRKLWDQADKLSLKSGRSEAGFVCPAGKVDCLPATSPKRAQFSKLILKANRLDKDGFLKGFDKGACEATSYADLCAAMKKNGMAYFDSQERWGKFVKVADPTSIRVNQESDRMKSTKKAADKAYKAALFKAHPTFKDDYRVKQDPQWREAFFTAATVEAIDELKKLRQKVLQQSVAQSV